MCTNNSPKLITQESTLSAIAYFFTDNSIFKLYFKEGYLPSNDRNIFFLHVDCTLTLMFTYSISINYDLKYVSSDLLDLLSTNSDNNKGFFKLSLMRVPFICRPLVYLSGSCSHKCEQPESGCHHTCFCLSSIHPRRVPPAQRF